MTTAPPLRLGQTTEEYENSFSDIWIKGFKDGSTRIRFCQEPFRTPGYTGPIWVTLDMHYWRPAGYFPHYGADCVGCANPDEKVREKRRNYFFNGLDETGRLNVYRVGATLYKKAKNRQQRIGTVLDRDFVIMREGSGLKTEYDWEPGEKYEVETPEQLHDIPAILGAKYEEAKAVWEAYDADAEEAESADTKVDVSDEADLQAAMAAAKSAVDSDLSTATTEAPEAVSEAPAAAEGQTMDFEDMSTPDLKAYLESRNVEFGERVTRKKLLEMASGIAF